MTFWRLKIQFTLSFIRFGLRCWNFHFRFFIFVSNFWGRSNAGCHTMNKTLKLSVYSAHDLIIYKSITLLFTDRHIQRQIYNSNRKTLVQLLTIVWSLLKNFFKRNGLSLVQSLLILHAKCRLSIRHTMASIKIPQLNQTRYPWKLYDKKIIIWKQLEMSFGNWKREKNEFPFWNNKNIHGQIF